MHPHAPSSARSLPLSASLKLSFFNSEAWKTPGPRSEYANLAEHCDRLGRLLERTGRGEEAAKAYTDRDRLRRQARN